MDASARFVSPAYPTATPTVHARLSASPRDRLGLTVQQRMPRAGTLLVVVGSLLVVLSFFHRDDRVILVHQ